MSILMEEGKYIFQFFCPETVLQKSMASRQHSSGAAILLLD